MSKTTFEMRRDNALWQGPRGALAEVCGETRDGIVRVQARKDGVLLVVLRDLEGPEDLSAHLSYAEANVLFRAAVVMVKEQIKDLTSAVIKTKP